MLPTPHRLIGVSACAFALCAPAWSAQGTTLKMKVPDLAEATLLGRMPAATTMNVTVALAPRSRTAFEAYVETISDPKSPLFRHFLTPKQVGDRFGADTTTINSTVGYLRAKGLTVTLAASNHLSVLATGSARNVERAFGTTINRYEMPTAGGEKREFYSYTSVPKIASSFANRVVSVGGLQTRYIPVPMSTIDPNQLRTLYSVNPLYVDRDRKGEGVSIGITNYDGYRLSDARLYYQTYGLPTPTGGLLSNIVKVPINGGNGEAETAGGEGDLDIQCVASMAPRSRIYIYDSSGANNYNAQALLARIAEDNVVDIVTESYGYPVQAETASEVTARHDLHLAISAQGITYMCASGDFGASFPDFPDSDPEVLSVGGSVATVNGSGTRLSETGWDGSGGGWVAYDVPFNRTPSFQRNSITPLSLPAGVDRRFFPDICLHATGANNFDSRDPRATGSEPFVGGYYLVYGGGITTASGTSASSPTFAGQLGLMLQELRAQEALDPQPNGTQRLGRIQDVLYTQIGQAASVFFDVTGGNVGPLPSGADGLGGPGYDFVTGLGAPSLSGLTSAFVGLSSEALFDSADSVDVFAPAAPSIVFGTAVDGDVGSLPEIDGVTYSLLSVRQSGVGQIAAAQVTANLQTTRIRRSAAARVALSIPGRTTGYVYLLNKASGRYDLQKTVTGTGTMTTVDVPFDASATSPYVNGTQVTILVRALKPARFGSAPFRLRVDQVGIAERVARN